MKLLTLALCALMLLTGVTAHGADNPRVTLQTSMGDVVIELYADRAPLTVANFLGYVREGGYDGTIFHRVIKKFMNQGGGFTADLRKRDTHAPIINEADNGLKNTRGTLAMARTGDPHSATNQFFVNTVDNPFLDFKDKSVRGWGYTVFGKVIKGMDVMDTIAALPTKRNSISENAPLTDVVIIKVAEINHDAAAKETLIYSEFVWRKDAPPFSMAASH